MNEWIDSLLHFNELTQVFRILLAIILGAIIGFEREKYGRPAGLRTHMIVCVASTLAMLVSIYGFGNSSNSDPARLAAQVISGIGFIGAGTIIRGDKDITGITTAATIWICAIIGLACGAGYYFGATITTILVLVILSCFTKIECKLSKGRRGNSNLIAVLKYDENIIEKVRQLFNDSDIVISSFEYKNQILEGEKVVKVNVGFASNTIAKKLNELLSNLDKELQPIQCKLTNETYVKSKK